MQSRNRRYLPRLDMLRAVAAWWVVMHHCFTMIPFSMLKSMDWTGSDNPVAVVFTAPSLPLTLFMVLSGYSIGLGLAGRSIRWSGYLAARVLRVAPLYWFLLALGILTGAATIAEILGVPENVPRSMTAALLMLPVPWSYSPFPWLATAWSVRIEVVLYLFAPVFVWLLVRWGRRTGTALVLTGCATLIVVPLALGANAWDVLHANVPGRLLEFACGFLLAYVIAPAPSRGIARRCGIAALLLIPLLTFVSNRAGGEIGMAGQWRAVVYAGGLMMALLLAQWASTSHQHGENIAARAAVRLGQWSYSTYLWHFTIMTFVGIPVAFRFTERYALGFWPHLLVGTLITCSLTVVVSYLSYRFIESPFLRIRPTYVRSESNDTQSSPVGA